MKAIKLKQAPIVTGQGEARITFCAAVKLTDELAESVKETVKKRLRWAADRIWVWSIGVDLQNPKALLLIICLSEFTQGECNEIVAVVQKAMNDRGHAVGIFRN